METDGSNYDQHDVRHAKRKQYKVLNETIHGHLALLQTIIVFDLLLVILSVTKNFNDLIIKSDMWATVIIGCLFIMLGAMMRRFVKVYDRSYYKRSRAGLSSSNCEQLISTHHLTFNKVKTILGAFLLAAFAFAFTFFYHSQVVDLSILGLSLVCFITGMATITNFKRELRSVENTLSLQRGNAH
ncbi:hypothetical protein [Mucilaginibacter sp. KACC 22063]|uniref:hypothetical protein n=1 Tax=Mucilaginibacter sp. KACC 22063 TaxID=3025666 RepID=UPI0023673E0C|nr:hypothetical protein [Mucilaginibacter sp. KACC 22063]WDF54176.1 hypothetical protein PQ461_14615 [Mucilaginibacter sp. KACC 22063]